MGSIPFAFTTPAVIFGLTILFVIWLLLRLIPPKPREVSFPPSRLLLDGPNQKVTPARTPWWLTLLRLLLAALIIFALAGPVWRPLDHSTLNQGRIALFIDNGWGSPDNWGANDSHG